MFHWKNNLLALARKLASLLGIYFLLRLLFFLFNKDYFFDLGWGGFLRTAFYGIRFDLSALILLNSLFILLVLFPWKWREHRLYRIFLKSLFLLSNSIAIAFNLVDIAYFPFTLKRSTADIFTFFSGKIGNDVSRLLPTFLHDYWYLVIIFLFLIYLLFVSYKRSETEIRINWNFKNWALQCLLFVSTLAVGSLIYRGGFQLKPISTVDAGEYVEARDVPLLVSSTFTILKTLDLEAIQPQIYFQDTAELKSIYNPVHAGSPKQFRPLNVFVIALESFSKEYVGSLNGRGLGYTPFLDSLISQSLVFNNAFSNGKKSIEGIPAITASIPTWMSDPYISSPYGSNQINSLPNLLKSQGYYSAFFHGGTNGTMGFDAYCKLAGFDDYFGRTEYNNEKDYDGNWGIWDEEFLQYTANTINQKKQPFFATVFTLTSHHPYPVPEKYKGRFKEGPLPIEHSIGYTDFCLKRFFETAKQMPWYKNTLFVLCADHTGISNDPFFVGKIGNNTIPIIYFMPEDSLLRGRSDETTQQIDILPSVLDYLHYPSPYYAFGESVFDSTATHFAMTYSMDRLSYIQQQYALEYNGNNLHGFYNYQKDSLLSNDIQSSDTSLLRDYEKRLQAIIQTYQQALINNKMTVK